MTVLAEGPGGPAADPVASACFRLGWRVEELFSQFAVPEGIPRAYDLTRLPGLGKLTSYDWQRLGLDQADFVVSRVIAKVGTPAGASLNLTADARAKLEATAADGDGAASRREDYRARFALSTSIFSSPSRRRTPAMGRPTAWAGHWQTRPARTRPPTRWPRHSNSTGSASYLPGWTN